MNETRLRIIEVLKQYSDENHRLTQNDIKRIYERDYEVSIDRKTVGRHLADLVDNNYPLVYKDSVGQNDKRVITDIYWENEFTNSELRLLIDLISFSRNIPINYAKELTDKLKNIGNKHLKRSLTNIYSVGELHSNASGELFLNVELISEAMDTNSKISFVVRKFNEEGKLVNSRFLPTIVNPYKLIAHNNAYYLLGNREGDVGLQNYKVDKMTEVRILNDERITPIEQIDSEYRDIGEYIKAHPLMNSGNPVRAKIKIARNVIDDIYDTFGSGIQVNKEMGSKFRYVADVRASAQDIIVWALMHGRDAEVIEPESIRERIHDIIFNLYRNYAKEYLNPYDKALTEAEGSGRLMLNMDLRELDKRYQKMTQCKDVLLKSNCINDFGFLKNFKETMHLQLSNNDVKDLSFLQQMESLEGLVLRRVTAPDWSVIAKCEGLKNLCITGNNIEDFSFVADMHGLISLEVDFDAWTSIDLKKLKENSPNVELTLSEDSRHLYFR